MIAGRPAEILRQLETPASPDRELLVRFVRERDQSAFAELVRRHGPVVLGVCRRVTGQTQDAEDAFQAVFLILARKAAMIGNPDLLGNWLYGVAVHVAQKARRSASRRRAREAVVSVMPDQPTSSSTMAPELSPILDEELAALPSWYRDAIVLCDLRGVSREEAAAALGVPEGTLSSRLANGRKKLAARLMKRGVTLAAGAIPAAFSSTGTAAVSNELYAKTCVLVADWMAGGSIPRPLVKLTEGGMTVRKMFTLGVLTAAAVVCGVVYAAQPAPHPPKADLPQPFAINAKQDVGDEPAPDDKQAETLKVLAFTNKPKLREIFDVNLIGIRTVYWNPQGTRLAIAGKEPAGIQVTGGANGRAVQTGQRRGPTVMYVLTGNSRETPTIIHPANNSRLLGYSADGKFLVTMINEEQLVSGIHRVDFWEEKDQVKPVPLRGIVNTQSIDVDSMELQGFAFAPDGRTFRTAEIEWNAEHSNVKNLKVLEMDATTGKPIKTLLKISPDPKLFLWLQFFDGKRLAISEGGEKVTIYDVDQGSKLTTFTLENAKADNPAPNTPPEGRPGYRRQFGPGMPAWEANELKLPKQRFSEDGRLLLYAHDVGVIKVINTDTGAELPALEKKQQLLLTPGQQAFGANGRLLASIGTLYAEEKQNDQSFIANGNSVLNVWDTNTGKILKTWIVSGNVDVAFNPVRPILAVLEPNGSDGTRVGLWDFSAEVAEKK